MLMRDEFEVYSEVSMIFEFSPWKIDVDIEKTKCLYAENDYSVDKEWNEIFVANLNVLQKDFFEMLGIDTMKIEVEKHNFEENSEVPFMLSVNFLFCGKFLTMPREQLELYRDEEIYGKVIEMESVESITTDGLAVYDELSIGTGIRFKHPVSHFEGSQYEKWDCGFINGALIVGRGISEKNHS